MITIAPAESRIIEPPSPLLDVETASVSVPLEVPEGSTTITERDLVFAIAEDVQARRDLAIATNVEDATFTSLDPAKAAVNANGYVTSTGDGNVGILVRSKWEVKRVTHNAGVDGVYSGNVFKEYEADSLGREMNDALDAMAGSSEDVNLFTIRNHADSVYVRNPSCWMTLDNTCWPVWNSYSGTALNGCLISPQHIAFVWHARPPKGSQIRFVTADNQVISRTVGDQIYVTFSGNHVADRIIAVLNAPVPSSIKFAKVLPANALTDYLTIWKPGDNGPFNIIPDHHVPLVSCDGQNRAYIREWKQIRHNRLFAHFRSLLPHRIAKTKAPVGGDSGAPLFGVVNGELVLLSLHSTSEVAYENPSYNTTEANGYVVHTMQDEINAAMTTLGGGYQLTQIDLSGFPSYA
jgi:hypothetical protein